MLAATFTRVPSASSMTHVQRPWPVLPRAQLIHVRGQSRSRKGYKELLSFENSWDPTHITKKSYTRKYLQDKSRKGIATWKRKHKAHTRKMRALLLRGGGEQHFIQPAVPRSASRWRHRAMSLLFAQAFFFLIEPIVKYKKVKEKTKPIIPLP